MKSLFLSLVSLVPLAASAASQQYWVAPTDENNCYWVKGFSLDNPASWDFDADKLNNKMDDDEEAAEIVANGGILDGHFCWAVSAANIAAQWEARNEETVQAELGRAPRSADDIFTEFKNAFYHTSGDAQDALDWYFVGNSTLPLKQGVSATGGYYKGLVTYETKYTGYRGMSNTGWSLVEEDPTVAYGWDKSAYDSVSIRRQWTNALVSTLSDGYSVSIGVEGFYVDEEGDTGTYGHALTLWGVELDSEGYLMRMWLTDSDDATFYAEDMGLFSVSCTAVEDTDWMYNVNFPNPGESLYVDGFSTYYNMQSDVAVDVDGEPYYWYNGYDAATGLGDRLSNITAVRITSKVGAENPIVPEPATGTLSLLALAGLAARRRRK